METRIRSCPICGSGAREVVMPLKPTPLGDYLTDQEETARKLPHYSLDVALCNDCGHLYLPLVVAAPPPASSHVFTVSAAPAMDAIFDGLTRRVTDSQNLTIIDVGSHDGSWLKMFRAKGFSVFGFENNELAASAAVSRGIPTTRGGFRIENIDSLGEVMSQVGIISANYALANMPDSGDFFQAVNLIASKETIVSILTGYHPHQFGCSMFDYVYHEHLSYFTVADFVRLAASHGLYIDSIEFVPLKGGSIHLVLKKGKHEPRDAVNRYLQFEEWQGVRTPEFYKTLMGRVDRAKIKTLESLATKSKSGAPVYCYGVSHSVTTFNYEMDLADCYSGAVDDNPERWEYFTPGTALRVKSPETLSNDRGSVVVVAAWQHDFRIRQRLLQLNFQGGVIQPLPRFAYFKGASL